MELGKKVKTALDETRMCILGAQILLGFELRGAFQDGFDGLPAHARYSDGVALLLMVATVGLLIAPGTYHRLVTRGRDTEEVHRLVSAMAGMALLPFALSLGLALFIAGEHLFGLAGGTGGGLSFALLALLTWYGIGYRRGRKARDREGAATPEGPG